MSKYVADLANAHDVSTGGSRQIQDRRPVRRHRIVAPVRRSFEAPNIMSDKWTRNHAPDAQRIDELSRNGAKLVEALQAASPLVCGDLEYAIRRGVADRRAGEHVLRTKLGDDFGPGRVTVAERAREPAAFT